MADSQSLTLLPPKPAAAPNSEQSIKKPAKPAHGKSFGQKLDTAKKQIAAKTTDLKPVPVPTKKPVALAAKTPEDPSAADDSATDEVIDPTSQKPVVKAPKPAVKDPADEDVTEEEQTASAEKSVEPTVVKAASPAKAVTDRSKKSAKTTDQKPTAAAPTQTAIAKAQADQAAKADDHSAGDASSDATDDDDDSTDGIASANNALFGSGKVIGKGNPGDANSTIVNAATDAADDEDTVGNAASALDPVAAAATEIAAAVDAPVAKAATESAAQTPAAATDVTGLVTPSTGNSPATLAAKSSAVSASPQVQFAEENHPKIITSIQGELLPKGGTMQLQLNPADLGALQVTVHLQDGVVSASFETSNDDATKLLSHSLGQLKSGLEAAGVTVEKLHVEQAPQKDSTGDSNSESDSKSPLQDQQRQAQQDQQRKDMVQRMWRRLAGGSDPLDLVA